MPKRSRHGGPPNHARKKAKKKATVMARPRPVVSRAAAPAEEATTPPSPTQTPRHEPFQDRLVIADLRKTGVIAGAIIVILIVLSLVLP